jgi:iron complex outermembrane recepter protein
MKTPIRNATLALFCIHVLCTGARAAETPASTEFPKMTVKEAVDGDYTAPAAVSTAKVDTPLLLTPMSIQTVPAQVLEDQQVVRLDTAVLNVSGVTPIESSGAGYGLASGTMLRGFVTQDYYRDGTRVASDKIADGFRDMANIDSVEVLKGPASTLYGRMEPGGIVNLVTKKPLDHAEYSVSQQVGSFDFLRTTLDATGPLGNAGSLLYRTNIAYEDSGTARDFVKNRHFFIAPMLRWKAGENDTVDFHAEYQDTRNGLDYGQPVIQNRPAALPVSRNISGPDGALESKRLTVGYDWTHSFGGSWSLHQRFDYSDLLDAKLTPSYVPFGPTAYWDGAGICDGSSCTTYLVPFKQNQDGRAYSVSADLTGKFSTGALRHSVLLGIDYQSLNASQTFAYSFDSPVLDIIHPVYNGPASAYTDSPNLIGLSGSKEKWIGLYAQDQIELPGHAYAVAGVRWDGADNAIFTQDLYRKNGNPLAPYAETANTDHAVKPRVGILWNPAGSLSLYANYVENFGLSQGRQQASNGDTSPLPPVTAQQFEIGAKGALLGGRLNASAAWYDIRKQHVAVTDPDPVLALEGYMRAVGEVENKGFELDMAGEILPGWKLIAAYSHIESRVTRDTGPTAGYDANDFPTSADTNLGNTGRRLANVPANSGSLWTTYDMDLPDSARLKIGGGVTASGERFGDAANSYVLPGYGLVNLMLAYDRPFGHSRLGAQLNVENLFDKGWYDSGSNAPLRSYGLIPGSPRRVLGQVRWAF